MTSLKNIENFTSQKNIAIAGVSRKNQKFGNVIYKELVKKEYNVFPVNPNMDEYEGRKCYTSISDLPNEVTGMVLNTKPEITKKLFDEALKKGIYNIWLQQGSADKKLLELVKNMDHNIIGKQCLLMFIEPVGGIHGFHKWLKKSFGKFPE